MMGRHDLRPLRVHQTANRFLATDKITALPNWHGVLGSIPPAPTLARTQPLQHKPKVKQAKLGSRKASKLFQPTTIGYEEDVLRETFFGDHPWELARPRVVLENDGRDYQKTDWSRIVQPGWALNGESVVQRQMWLQHNVPSMSPAKAYDQARKEFYRLRLQEDVQRLVAQEEALATGAYFHKSTLEIGMDLEDKQFEEWKAWAIKEVQLADQQRNAMYTGQENQAMDMPAGDPETEAGIEEVSDALPAQGQSAQGGARVMPASQQ